MSVATRSSSGYGWLATSNTTSTRLSLSPPWWGCCDAPGRRSCASSASVRRPLPVPLPPFRPVSPSCGSDTRALGVAGRRPSARSAARDRCCYLPREVFFSPCRTDSYVHDDARPPRPSRGCLLSIMQGQEMDETPSARQPLRAPPSRRSVRLQPEDLAEESRVAKAL